MVEGQDRAVPPAQDRIPGVRKVHQVSRLKGIDLPPGMDAGSYGVAVVAVSYGRAVAVAILKRQEEPLTPSEQRFDRPAVVEMVALKEICGKPVQVQHKPVIVEGLLNRSSIRENLMAHLLLQEIDPSLEPPIALLGPTEKGTGKYKPHGLADRVIPEGGVERQPPGDPPGMAVDGLGDDPAFRPRIVAKGFEGIEENRDPESALHSARIVGAVRKRVFPDPAKYSL
jgi:hypothetical protein